MKALLPPAGAQRLLANNAAAGEQLARLLDALLVLDVEKSCSIGDLAHRVGLQPSRLRELLSSFMVAGPDAVGPDAPFSIVFGTASGPLDADTEYDADQVGADFVYVASAALRDEQVSLVDDVGRAPITVDQVAAAVLAGRTLLEGDALEPRHRTAVAALVDKLAAAVNMTLNEPVDPDAQRLRAAVQARQRVQLRYQDPGEGAEETLVLDPYDVRRRRDSFVLDAGPDEAEGYRTYDVAGMSDLEVVGDPGAFEPPPLPARDARDHAVDVVLRVPTGSPAADRLADGWGATVAAASNAHVDLKIKVDRPAASRVAILLLQLGPQCSVVSPESFVPTVTEVAQRILEAHQT